MIRHIFLRFLCYNRRMDITQQEKTCCFTGYRAAKLPWGYNETDPDCVTLKAVIADAVEAAYEAGFRHFICGMATGIDTYFGEAVAALRDERPEITLEAAAPFRGHAESLPRSQQERCARLLAACDTVTVLSEERTRRCMMERNRYMVDRSSLVIAVYDGKRGGTYNTVRYAEKQKRTTVVLPVSGYTKTMGL